MNQHWSFHISVFFLSCVLLSSVTFGQETLRVYTYDSFVADWGPGPILKKEFEAQYNCNLDFLGLSDGAEILTRLRLERANPKADIALGLDSNLTEEARNTGLFVGHGIDTSGLSMPVTWNNPYFLPYDYGWFAFVYKKSAVKTPPTSFKDIINAASGHSIIIQDPRLSTPGLGLLLWIKQVYGTDAEDTWKQLSRRVVTVTKGWSGAYNLFLKGESDMVFSYTTSPSYHRLAEGSQDYAAALFEEGNYLQIEVAGILQSSRKQALARRFLEFLISKQAQAVIPETQWMLPVVKVPLPKGFEEGIYPTKSVYLSPRQAAENKTEWIQEWKRGLSQ